MEIGDFRNGGDVSKLATSCTLGLEQNNRRDYISEMLIAFNYLNDSINAHRAKIPALFKSNVPND